MPSVLTTAVDGRIESSDGWSARMVSTDLLEYVDGHATCLVNVEYLPVRRARAILASESTSALFPNLKENLRQCAPLLDGGYLVL